MYAIRSNMWKINNLREWNVVKKIKIIYKFNKYFNLLLFFAILYTILFLFITTIA